LTAALARLNNESLIMVKFRPVAAAALSALLGLGIVWCADAHAERHLFNAYDLLAWCESEPSQAGRMRRLSEGRSVRGI
jgi:hypothetical protein